MEKQQKSAGFIIFIGVLSAVPGCAQETPEQFALPAASATVAAPSYSFPTFKYRFLDYLDRAAGPVTEVRVALQAGVAQGVDHPDGWGQGADSYGKRYAWWWTENWIAETAKLAANESFHLDGTYHRSSAHSVAPRIRHAIRETFLARTRSGRTIVSVSNLAAPYVAAMYSTYAWYPGHPNWKQGVKTGSISLAIQPGLNLLREFVFKR